MASSMVGRGVTLCGVLTISSCHRASGDPKITPSNPSWSSERPTDRQSDHNLIEPTYPRQIIGRARHPHCGNLHRAEATNAHGRPVGCGRGSFLPGVTPSTERGLPDSEHPAPHDAGDLGTPARPVGEVPDDAFPVGLGLVLA